MSTKLWQFIFSPDIRPRSRALRVWKSPRLRADSSENRWLHLVLLCNIFHLETLSGKEQVLLSAFCILYSLVRITVILILVWFYCWNKITVSSYNISVFLLTSSLRMRKCQFVCNLWKQLWYFYSYFQFWYLVWYHRSIELKIFLSQKMFYSKRHKQQPKHVYNIWLAGFGLAPSLFLLQCLPLLCGLEKKLWLALKILCPSVAMCFSWWVACDTQL